MTLHYYQLTKDQTKLWLRMPGVRRVMAAEYLRRYPAGCHILAWSWGLPCHIATIDPRGEVRKLPRPYRRVPYHEISNKPDTPACPCADLLHPEYGSWRNHPDFSKGLHHPYCQFDKTSGTVYREVLLKTTGGEPHPELGKVRYIPQRPDEMDRARERALDTRRDKSGARRQ